MSLAASLSGKCCRCKQSQHGKYVFEDQNTQLIYCQEHQHTVPKKANLVKIRIFTIPRPSFCTLMSCSSSAPSSDEESLMIEN